MPFPRLAAMLFASLAGTLAMAAPKNGKTPAVPLESLKKLAASQGSLALIPASDAGEDNNHKLYLANTTGKTLPGLAHSLPPIFKEVRLGGKWRRCESFGPEICADMTWFTEDPPPDLPPGHACAKTVSSWNHGSVKGTVRYCLPLIGSPPLVSRSLEGRYSPEDLKAATRDVYSYKGIFRDLICLREEGWSESSIFRGAGELAAVLELERAYDVSGAQRSSVARWLEEAAAGTAPASRAELAAIRAVLERPWDRDRDERNCLEACMEALEKAGRENPVGSPARYPAIVWSYLNQQPRWRDEGATYPNPERHAALEALKASGNPWGATPEECRKLAALAGRSIRSGDEREARQARAFLNMIAEGKR